MDWFRDRFDERHGAEPPDDAARRLAMMNAAGIERLAALITGELIAANAPVLNEWSAAMSTTLADIRALIGSLTDKVAAGEAAEGPTPGPGEQIVKTAELDDLKHQLEAALAGVPGPKPGPGGPPVLPGPPAGPPSGPPAGGPPVLPGPPAPPAGPPTPSGPPAGVPPVVAVPPPGLIG